MKNAIVRWEPEPVIPWLFWKQPFSRTARGFVCRWETTGAAALLFASCGLFSVCLYCDGLALMIPVVFLAALAFCIIKLWPMRRIVRRAKANCERWREEWRRFEEDAAEFADIVRHNGVPMSERFEVAPTFPPVSWNLSHYIEEPIPQDELFRRMKPIDLMIAIRTNLSRVLTALIALGGRSVVGASSVDPSVLGIFVLKGNLQFWVRVRYVMNGASIYPELLMGVQTASGPFNDGSGRKYPGDLAKIRFSRLCGMPLLLLLTLPHAGYLVLACMLLLLIPYFRTNLAANLEHRLRSHCGDAADMEILQTEKAQCSGSDKWFTLTSQVESDIAALKYLVLNAVQTAIQRQDY